MKSVCGRVLPRLVLAAAPALPATSAFAQGEVNVYTYRETKLIQPLFDAFTKDTGIKVNVVSAANGLEQRIRTEGANSPADVLLTVDISRLEEAVRAGITQPIKSELLDKVVAPHYRDPEGHWYARLDARAHGLRLEGAREADRAELRGPRQRRPGTARSASAPASTTTTSRCSRPTSSSTARRRPSSGCAG